MDDAAIPHHPLIRSCGYAKTPMPFVVLAGASVNTIAELSSIRPTTRSGQSAPAAKLTITGSTEVDDNQCADHATVYKRNKVVRWSIGMARAL